KEEISHNLIIKAKRLPYWDEQVLPLIKELGIDGRIKLIDNKYSEAEMHKLYSNASLFVSPSLMEGFGFTPIEAAIHC
ncbi:UNVERIFIED_CONTAM: glycosyltransferase, partial [Bacteroidetes bacterium 56_B9]